MASGWASSFSWSRSAFQAAAARVAGDPAASEVTKAEEKSSSCGGAESTHAIPQETSVEPGSTASAAPRLRCTHLVVHAEHGAGIEVAFVPFRGYLLENIAASPGQPELKVGDMIVAAGGQSLALELEEAADEVLAASLQDGVELQVEVAGDEMLDTDTSRPEVSAALSLPCTSLAAESADSTSAKVDLPCTSLSAESTDATAARVDLPCTVLGEELAEARHAPSDAELPMSLRFAPQGLKDQASHSSEARAVLPETLSTCSSESEGVAALPCGLTGDAIEPEENPWDSFSDVVLARSDHVECPRSSDEDRESVTEPVVDTSATNLQELVDASAAVQSIAAEQAPVLSEADGVQLTSSLMFAEGSLENRSIATDCEMLAASVEVETLAPSEEPCLVVDDVDRMPPPCRLRQHTLGSAFDNDGQLAELPSPCKSSVEPVLAVVTEPHPCQSAEVASEQPSAVEMESEQPLTVDQANLVQTALMESIVEALGSKFCNVDMSASTEAASSEILLSSTLASIGLPGSAGTLEQSMQQSDWSSQILPDGPVPSTSMSQIEKLVDSDVHEESLTIVETTVSDSDNNEKVKTVVGAAESVDEGPNEQVLPRPRFVAMQSGQDNSSASSSPTVPPPSNRYSPVKLPEASNPDLEVALPTASRGSTRALAHSSNSDTHCKVQGLWDWLCSLSIEEYFEDAAKWCQEMGAVNLDELAENIDDFSEAVALKPIERQRVQKWALQNFSHAGSGAGGGYGWNTEAEEPDTSAWSSLSPAMPTDSSSMALRRMQRWSSSVDGKWWNCGGNIELDGGAELNAWTPSAASTNAEPPSIISLVSGERDMSAATPVYTARNVRLAMDARGGTGLGLQWCDEWGVLVESVDPLPGQPGLRPGDYIVAIDGCSLRHRTHEECDEIFAARLRERVALSVVTPTHPDATASSRSSQRESGNLGCHFDSYTPQRGMLTDLRGKGMSRMPRAPSQATGQHAWRLGKGGPRSGRGGYDANSMWRRFRGPVW